MHRFLLALACAAGAGLGGCAATPTLQSDALLQLQPAGLPARSELAAVPFITQTSLHGAPAALASVLQFAGMEASADELSDAVYLPARDGSLQMEMLAAARRKGAVATRLPPRLDAVVSEVAAGMPVVVLQNLGLAVAPVWHYAVVVGFDLDRGELIMRSGTSERAQVAFGVFEQTWARAGYWAFVVQLPGQVPATAQQQAAIDAAVGFERAAEPRAAARQYEAVLKRWPDSLIAAMGLGNTRLAAGEMAGAASAYETAALHHDSAAAWNNLALLRWREGDVRGALTALARAEARVRQAEPRWAQAVQATRATMQLR